MRANDLLLAYTARSYIYTVCTYMSFIGTISPWLHLQEARTSTQARDKRNSARTMPICALCDKLMFDWKRRADKFVIKMLELLGNVCARYIAMCAAVWLEKTVNVQSYMYIGISCFVWNCVCVRACVCVYVIDIWTERPSECDRCVIGGYDHCFWKESAMAFVHQVKYLQFHTRSWQAKDMTFLLTWINVPWKVKYALCTRTFVIHNGSISLAKSSYE